MEAGTRERFIEGTGNQAPMGGDGPRTSAPAAWHALPASFRAVAGEHERAILLETAKQDGACDRSLLFLDPHRELVARSPDELETLLDDVDRLVADGWFVAGYFSYECGESFVGLPSRDVEAGGRLEPLAWFGAYKEPVQFDHRSGTVCGELPAARKSAFETAAILTEGLQLAPNEYDAAIAAIHQYLQAGDTYQVNFTDRIDGETDSNPLAVYETLLARQPVSFAAFLNLPAGPVLSFSPELFYRTSQGRICVRPMKGTWPRGLNVAGDRKAEAQLLNDEKNRSEHVMIVDLLRNDLGGICSYGSVRVDELFRVERYSTLLQMTSTCSGELREGLSPARVLRSLFPSGSITGAPKRRTMEIIRELERQPRGVYTGSIGYFGPDGEACFSVAIRTLKLQGRRLTMGVGGGITADSKADEEYEECRLKAEFLTRKRPAFSLIETMRSVDGEIALLPRHMRRLAESAAYFGRRYDESALWSELVLAADGCGETECRIRLLLDEAGAWTITALPLELATWSGRLLLAEERTCSTDVFLHHKTTHRGMYEESFSTARRMGFDEVLFLNEREHLTEGAISNLFLQVGGRWVTPSLQCGVLPGVQRSHMLEELGDVEERELQLEDLRRAEAVSVCNALRGMRAARSIELADGSVLWKKR